MPCRRQTCAKVDGRRRFPDAALLVDNRDDAAHSAARTIRRKRPVFPPGLAPPSYIGRPICAGRRGKPSDAGRTLRTTRATRRLSVVGSARTSQDSTWPPSRDATAAATSLSPMTPGPFRRIAAPPTATNGRHNSRAAPIRAVARSTTTPNVSRYSGRCASASALAHKISTSPRSHALRRCSRNATRRRDASTNVSWRSGRMNFRGIPGNPAPDPTSATRESRGNSQTVRGSKESRKWRPMIAAALAAAVRLSFPFHASNS